MSTTYTQGLPPTFDSVLSNIPNAQKATHKTAWQLESVRTGAVIVFTAALQAGIIGITFQNVCLTYATTLFWSVMGVYLFTLLMIIIATVMYFNFSYFCDWGLWFEHIMDLLSLNFGMCSVLGYYCYYTFLPSDSGPYAAMGSAVQFFVTFGLLWITFIEKHRHNCLKSDEKAFLTGSPFLMNLFYAAYYLAIISWFTIIGLAMGFDYQLWQSGSDRSETKCY